MKRRNWVPIGVASMLTVLLLLTSLSLFVSPLEFRVDRKVRPWRPDTRLKDALDAGKTTAEIAALIQQDRTVLTQFWHGGDSALHYAAALERADLVPLFVENGIDVNVAVPRDWGNAGETAICYAARNGDLATIQALERCGAKFDVQSCWGEPLELIARRAKHEEVAEYIRAQLAQK